MITVTGLLGESILPHINASLNLTASLLLIAGVVLIKLRKEQAHKITMGSAFLVSTAFLICYLTYHVTVPSTKFPRETYPTVAIFYYIMLASHILLAITVPVLAIWTIYLGWRDRRAAHKRLAKFTFPIWFYVSVTGVLIYLMLYWWFPGDVG
jgi:uncharacterized membrane protein YozB (DUF420 family)